MGGWVQLTSCGLAGEWLAVSFLSVCIDGACLGYVIRGQMQDSFT